MDSEFLGIVTKAFPIKDYKRILQCFLLVFWGFHFLHLNGNPVYCVKYESRFTR